MDVGGAVEQDDGRLAEDSSPAASRSSVSCNDAGIPAASGPDNATRPPIRERDDAPRTAGRATAAAADDHGETARTAASPAAGSAGAKVISRSAEERVARSR